VVTDRFPVLADKGRLASTFEHVIQNAQDAAGKKGAVRVGVKRVHDQVVIDIKDDGSGMEANFIKNRLFKPFDSTKGLTGMGIGAYESREYIRTLDGSLQVRSTVGQGTLFQFLIPLAIELSKVPEASAGQLP